MRVMKINPEGKNRLWKICGKTEDSENIMWEIYTSLHVSKLSFVSDSKKTTHT